MAQGKWLDRALSATAGLIAVVALATAVYTAWITRRQQEISVWPYVVQLNSDAGGQYRRMVVNAGLGPALIRSFQVLVDGKPMHSWTDVMHAAGLKEIPQDLLHSDLGDGDVLSPGDTLSVVLIPDAVEGHRFHAVVVPHLETVVCYCSLYGECWKADSEKTAPRRASCNQPAAAGSD